MISLLVGIVDPSYSTMVRIITRLLGTGNRPREQSSAGRLSRVSGIGVSRPVTLKRALRGTCGILVLEMNCTRRFPCRNPTFHPTYQSDVTRPIRHHRTKNSDFFGPFRRHRTSPTVCFHLIIPRSWVRSPPALLFKSFSTPQIVRSRVAVMESCLKDDNIVSIKEIDESMLLVNSSRPTSFENVSKRFRFANSVGRMTQHVFEKTIHSLQGRFVVGLPIAVVLPTHGSNNETHQVSSCSSR